MAIQLIHTEDYDADYLEHANADNMYRDAKRLNLPF